MTPDFLGLAFMGLWVVANVMLVLAAVLPVKTNERPQQIPIDGDESIIRLVWLSLLPEKECALHQRDGEVIAQHRTAPR